MSRRSTQRTDGHLFRRGIWASPSDQQLASLWFTYPSSKGVEAGVKATGFALTRVAHPFAKCGFSLLLLKLAYRLGVQRIRTEKEIPKPYLTDVGYLPNIGPIGPIGPRVGLASGPGWVARERRIYI